jgi:probable rRNA maturation factor
LKELSNPEGELSILFTGDSEMKRLNARYRGKNAATDVLSFPSMDGPAASACAAKAPLRRDGPKRSGRADGPVPDMLGDIVISIPAARRQAKSGGLSLERETLFLLVHGLLHILGHDHEQSRTAAREMESLQKRLMAVGYPG